MRPQDVHEVTEATTEDSEIEPTDRRVDGGAVNNSRCQPQADVEERYDRRQRAVEHSLDWAREEERR